MPPRYCAECGGSTFRRLGEIKNTRQYICIECWAGYTEYVDKVKCDHEYSIRAQNKCIHCGKPK